MQYLTATRTQKFSSTLKTDPKKKNQAIDLVTINNTNEVQKSHLDDDDDDYNNNSNTFTSLFDW